MPTREVVLRTTVTHADRRALEMFSREFAALLAEQLEALSGQVRNILGLRT